MRVEPIISEHLLVSFKFLFGVFTFLFSFSFLLRFSFVRTVFFACERHMLVLTVIKTTCVY